jgi:hypothetical protein
MPRVKEIVESWVTDDVIKVREEPVTHTYALLAVDKLDGDGNKDVRLCIDLRPLNKIMIDTKYPVPLIADVLQCVGQFKGKNSFRTKIDCTAAYHRFKCTGVPICFTFESVVYQFVVAMFGAKPMTSIFQRVADDIVRPFKVIRPYVDDFSFGSPNKEHAVIMAVKLIDELTDFKIIVNKKKSKFAQRELTLLGHKLGPEGRSMCQDKVKALLDWPVPETGKQIMRFLGAANYYRSYIPKFSLLSVPLDKLRNKGKVFFNEEEQAAFEALKAAVAQNIQLVYPDIKLGIFIGVDASGSGVGAWRAQLKEVCKDKDPQAIVFEDLDVIEFASKAFPVGKNYASATMRELQGVIFAVKKFLPYLYGRHFIIFTDHSALVHLFTKPEPSPLIHRWIDLLQSLQFDVIHWKGEKNVVADRLSRQHSSSSIVNEVGILKGKKHQMNKTSKVY